MRINATFHIFVLFTAGLMFSMPFVTLAQQTNVQAVAAAEADANQDVNKPLWFGAGFLLAGTASLLEPYGYIMLLGGLAGYIYQPAPPPTRLMGKSPEYITAYTAAYKSKVGQVQANLMGAGCLSGCLIVALLGGGIGFGIGGAAVTQ